MTGGRVIDDKDDPELAELYGADRVAVAAVVQHAGIGREALMLAVCTRILRDQPARARQPRVNRTIIAVAVVALGALAFAAGRVTAPPRDAVIADPQPAAVSVPARPPPDAMVDAQLDAAATDAAATPAPP